VSAQLDVQLQATPERPQPKAAKEEDREDDRDESPRDSKTRDIDNDPPEAPQREEPVREAPEPRDMPDEPPHDTHPDQQP
jgi:hypothetical protein